MVDVGYLLCSDRPHDPGGHDGPHCADHSRDYLRHGTPLWSGKRYCVRKAACLLRHAVRNSGKSLVPAAQSHLIQVATEGRFRAAQPASAQVWHDLSGQAPDPSAATDAPQYLHRSALIAISRCRPEAEYFMAGESRFPDFRHFGASQEDHGPHVALCHLGPQLPAAPERCEFMIIRDEAPPTETRSRDARTTLRRSRREHLPPRYLIHTNVETLCLL